MERELRQRRPINKDNGPINNENDEKVHSKGKFDKSEILPY